MARPETGKHHYRWQDTQMLLSACTGTSSEEALYTSTMYTARPEKTCRTWQPLAAYLSGEHVATDMMNSNAVQERALWPEAQEWKSKCTQVWTSLSDNGSQPYKSNFKMNSQLEISVHGMWVQQTTCTRILMNVYPTIRPQGHRDNTKQEAKATVDRRPGTTSMKHQGNPHDRQIELVLCPGAYSFIMELYNHALQPAEALRKWCTETTHV